MPTRRIPDLRHILPFVDQMWFVPHQYQCRIGPRSRKSGRIIQAIRTFRLTKRRPCFTAPFRSNDFDRSECMQQLIKSAINHTRTIPNRCQSRIGCIGSIHVHHPPNPSFQQRVPDFTPYPFPILRHAHSRFYALFAACHRRSDAGDRPASGRQAVDDRSASAAAVHRRRPRNANFPADPLQFRRPIWKIRVPWMAGHRWLDTRQDAQLDASDGSDSSVGPVGPDEDNGNRTTAQRRSTADGP